MKIINNKVNYNNQEYKVENHDTGGILTDKAEKMYNGKYIGRWDLGYVFKSHNPNRELGHKDYFMLNFRYDPLIEDHQLFISGMDEPDLKKRIKQSAVMCHHCKTVIWSLHRHDYHSCRCEDKEKQVCVDGGSDYLRMAYGKESKYSTFGLDHLNKVLIEGYDND